MTQNERLAGDFTQNVARNDTVRYAECEAKLLALLTRVDAAAMERAVKDAFEWAAVDSEDNGYPDHAKAIRVKAERYAAIRAASPQPVAGELERFEKWALTTKMRGHFKDWTDSYFLRRDELGGYCLSNLNEMWAAWQARGEVR